MHRIAFSIFGLPVYFYGIMLVCGVIGAYLTVVLTNRRARISTPEVLLDCVVWILLAGLAGARLAYVMLNWDHYSSNPVSVLNLRSGGLTLYGSLVAGFAAFIVFCRIKKLPVLKMLDLFAPAVLVGIAFGRVGCFLNGCCYGVPAPPPFGVVFADAGIPGARYPIQLYETFLCLLGAAFLLWFERKRRFDGESFLMFACIYALVRFSTEFIRGIDSSSVFFGLTLAQTFSLLVILSCIGVSFVLRGRAAEGAGNAGMAPEAKVESGEDAGAGRSGKRQGKRSGGRSGRKSSGRR